MVNQNVTQEMSPGALLKKAREAKKLSQEQIAKQLRLSLQWIENIENDDYSRAAAIIYVRGYLRSYARLVDVSADLVMEGLAALGLEEEFHRMKSQEEKITLQPIVPVLFSETHKFVGRRTIRWVSIFMFLVLMVLVALWWQGQRKHTVISSMSSKLTMQSQDMPMELQRGKAEDILGKQEAIKK